MSLGHKSAVQTTQFRMWPENSSLSLINFSNDYVSECMIDYYHAGADRVQIMHFLCLPFSNDFIFTTDLCKLQGKVKRQRHKLDLFVIESL